MRVNVLLINLLFVNDLKLLLLELCLHFIQHDPKECQPTEKKGGKYIMYDKATTGTKKNNRFFSKCSIDSMVPVISE